ncbi:toxin-antitoxin system YwqK family antitoxin [Poritiphilus flavus]|uniref:MORN repeat variant n=1 Tax=Poritiphilus flavus TaxID=2697053 RepID=A0A6L9EE39_9FLAO|nr:hypothetical protein [Poritiphilus flavus]NAS12901.1 hypothetical protein [Poritiphilus flavus]
MGIINLLKQSKAVIILLVYAMILSSCQEKTHFVKRNYYPSGELLSEIPYKIADSIKDGIYKDFYKNGQLKQVIHIKNGVPVDSALKYYETGELHYKELRANDSIYGSYFYKNGDIAAKNKFLDTDPPLQIGMSYIYSKDGNVRDSMEYLNIGGKSYLNTRYHHNDLGEVVPDSSYFYEFKISKIRNTDRYRLRIYYIPSMKEAQMAMVIGEDLAEDFSNLNNVRLDTIVMDGNSIVTDNLKKPNRRLKGFFYEYLSRVKDTIGKDSITLEIMEKKTFFNETVKVSDSINILDKG